jgi:hypothetical protein
MFEPNVTRKDRTAALRMRRYRARKRNGAVTAGRDGRPPDRVTLSDQQQAAIDVLLDVIEAHGKPGSEGEPEVDVELWRTALRNMFRPEHPNARRAVRRVMQAMFRLGCVIERDGLVAVGTFDVDIKVAGFT